MPDLTNNITEQLKNDKIVTELNYILRDLFSGDESVSNRPEFKSMNLDQVKAALDFILTDNSLSDIDKESLLSNTWMINFRDRPPTPEEFVTHKYIGPVAQSMFPHVRQAFLDFFDATKPYRTLVLYPHIGWGKSFLTVLVNLYIAVHVSMMRYPWKFFGQSPATIYTQVFGAASLKKSSELLFEPLLNVIESSAFFEKVHTKEGMSKREKDFSRMNNINRIFWTTAVPTSAIQFSNGANFKLISSPNSLLGQTIITGSLTELAWFSEAGKSDEYVYRFFSKLRGRIESRMKGNYYGRFVLDTSPNTLESVIDDWVVNVAPKNPQNFIIQGSRWKWNPQDFSKSTFDEDGRVKIEKAFVVYKGGKGKVPRIIDKREVKDFSPDDLILVPDTFEMRSAFEENVYEALKDLAGLPAGSADKIFYDYDKLETIFTSNLKNVYTAIQAPYNDPPEHLIWKIIEPIFFVPHLKNSVFWYKPYLSRVLSVDQSISGDVTAISLVHPEFRSNPNTGETETVYVTDFTIPIVPAGGRINLDAIRFFIKDLRDLGSINIVKVSFDRFQSEATVQYLKRHGFDVEYVSVDKTMDPYLEFINIIESNRFYIGKNIFFKNNLKSLIMTKRKQTKTPKVDHTLGDLVLTGNESWDTSFIGIHSKDLADSVCASCELIRKHDIMNHTMWKPEEIEQKTYQSSQARMETFLESMDI
jgi:hypothetical protein